MRWIGFELVAVITKASAERLGLAEGKESYAITQGDRCAIRG